MKKYLTPFNVLKTVFVSLICISLLIPAYAYGADKFSAKASDIKVEKSILGNNASPWSFSSSNSAQDVDTLTDYKESGATAIPFSMLYGSWFKSSSYSGEGNRNNSKTTKSPYEASPSTINGWNRFWVQGKDEAYSDSEGTFTSLWGDSMLSEKEDFDDLHMYNICNPKGGSNLITDLGDTANTFFALVCSFFHSINTGICNICINVANFDVGDLANKIGMKQMNNTLAKLLLADNGNISPLLIIAIMAFIFGLVGIVFGYLRQGSASIKQLVTEVAFLFLACVCFGMANNGGLYSMQSTLTNAVTSATSSIATEGSDTATLYTSESGDGLRDTKNTQMASLQKPYIDAVIRSQFGVSVSELDLENSKWGGVDVGYINRNLVNNVEGIDAITVSTGDSDHVSHNLGYYWYACSSGLNPNYPYPINTKNFEFNRTGTSGAGFIGDFLAAVNHQGNAETGQKCTAIMQALNRNAQPGLLLVVIDILEVLMVITIGSLCIYNLTSKFIFGIGIIAFPIMPILLLIKNTRSLAKQVLMTWVISLLKIAIASAMITFVIAMTAKLIDVDAGGILGVVLAAIFLIVMFKAIPAVMSYLTRMLTRLGGGQLEAVNAMDRWCDKNMFQKQANAFQGHGMAKSVKDKTKSLGLADLSKANRQNRRDALEDKLTGRSENIAKENQENREMLHRDEHTFDNILKEQEGAMDESEHKEFDEDGNLIPSHKTNFERVKELDSILADPYRFDKDTGLLSKKFLGLDEDVSEEEWTRKSVEEYNNLADAIPASMLALTAFKNGGKQVISDGAGGFVTKNINSRDLNNLGLGNTAKENMVQYSDKTIDEIGNKELKKVSRRGFKNATACVGEIIGDTLDRKKQDIALNVGNKVENAKAKANDFKGNFEEAEKNRENITKNLKLRKDLQGSTAERKVSAFKEANDKNAKAEFDEKEYTKAVDANNEQHRKEDARIMHRRREQDKVNEMTAEKAADKLVDTFGHRDEEATSNGKPL